MVIRLSIAVLVSVLCASASMAQVRYFPPGGFADTEGLDKSVSERYSKQLTALEEPSLWELSKTQKTEAYRFLWLRTFHHPVAIRIEIQADGTSTITTKMAGGAGGYDPGKLIENDSVAIDKEQTASALRTISGQNFWRLPSRDPRMGGPDGAQWVVEGIKNGNYHFVDRWSPEDGEVRAIGLLFIKKLAKLRVSRHETY